MGRPILLGQLYQDYQQRLNFIIIKVVLNPHNFAGYYKFNFAITLNEEALLIPQYIPESVQIAVTITSTIVKSIIIATLFALFSFKPKYCSFLLLLRPRLLGNFLPKDELLTRLK